VSGFRKFSRRQANGATIVTVAAQVEVEAGLVSAARVALGGADRVSRRFPEAESVLLGSPFTAENIAAAAAAAAGAANPVTDANASEWYRRRMIEVQLKQVLGKMAGRV